MVVTYASKYLVIDCGIYQISNALRIYGKANHVSPSQKTLTYIFCILVCINEQIVIFKGKKSLTVVSENFNFLVKIFGFHNYCIFH